MRFRRRQEAPAAAPAPAGSPAALLRPLLYGDVPLGDWPPPGEPPDAEPWATFVRARGAVAEGRAGEAVAAWLSVARDPRAEPRSALQAWTFLRLAGFSPPPDEAETVLGVVCEVGVGQGHDILAVYRDGSARYLNHAGRAAVLEERWPEAHAVVEAAAPLGGVIGLWAGELPPLPAGHTRVLLLTPGGFRFGQGPTDAVFDDPLAGGVLRAALPLVQRLTSQG